MSGITLIAENNFDQILETHKQFLAQLPCQALVQGILEKRIPGQILYLENEPICILMTTNRIGAVLAGQPNEQQLKTILELLSKHEKSLLICPQSLQSFFMEHGYAVQKRMAFECTSPRYFVKDFMCPDGYVVQPINSIDIFKQCSGFSAKTVLWGSPENFLENSFGYVLVSQEGKVVAECYGAWCGNDMCEIVVATHPDFQGNGFSTFLTKHFIHECFARNVTPLWSCNCDNAASIKVALKCGFKVKNYYTWLMK